MTQILAFLVISFGLKALALAAPPPFEFHEEALRQAFTQPYENDGPNCFNTAFVAAGYTTDVIHTSTVEALFVLKNFCSVQKIPAEQAPNGAFIAYYAADSKLIHLASSLGQQKVFEKLTYAGAHRKKPRGSATAGQYLFQSLNQSYYFKNYSPKNIKTYFCASPEEVSQKLSALNLAPQAQGLLQLRSEMAADIAKTSPADLNNFFDSQVPDYTQRIVGLLNMKKPTSAFEQEYLKSLVTSLHDQLYFMVDGAPISCEVCTKRSLRPMLELLRQIDFLLAKNYSRADWSKDFTLQFES